MKASQFQFVNPYLVELYFSVNPEFNEVNGKAELKNSFSIQVKRSEVENRANVELALDTNMEEEDSPFKLRAKVASDFTWEDMEENKVEAMLKFNAPALLLGYMRPIVATVTNASILPPYNLPFVDFTK